MIVFKFGGASVNSAAAVRNMADIVSRYKEQRLAVVVSAMGKTTNRLERMVPGVANPDEVPELLAELQEYHMAIVKELFDDGNNEVYNAVNELFEQLRHAVDSAPSPTPQGYNADYDRVVSFGELISTTIISHYLNYIGLHNQWVDVRQIIITDTHHREGRVNWEATRQRTKVIGSMIDSGIMIVTQGFIAGATDGSTTTLGREGSDYSAAILSHCLGAESMTIWKDVPGFLNADPKYFNNTVKISQIPYNEAIELAYYGASVIHPKTAKPLQNSNIKLHIRSFVEPEAEGSTVGPYDRIEPVTPLYIFRNQQVLLSIMPKDFSFIAEDNLQIIFGTLADIGVRVNMMQNSALSFSVVVDDNTQLLDSMTTKLGHQFRVRYNRGLQLITIRNYTQEVIDSIVNHRPILLEQRSRSTVQVLVTEG
ncbi:MAG: aspartate kinase [Bacteroidales bacterium]|nr:aspartate kinase [Bacteroidales bacterium]